GLAGFHTHQILLDPSGRLDSRRAARGQNLRPDEDTDAGAVARHRPGLDPVTSSPRFGRNHGCLGRTAIVQLVAIARHEHRSAANRLRALGELIAVFRCFNLWYVSTGFAGARKSAGPAL